MMTREEIAAIDREQSLVPAQSIPAQKNRGKQQKLQQDQESFLTVEIRTSSGSAMRIQGNMTAAHMRKSFNGLSGIVTNGMCASLKSGDVYIFMNASRNMMKMLRQEEGGLVLYAIRLDMGRMKSAVQTSDGEVISSGISYEDMLGMVRSALDSPYVRRMKMLSKSL